MLRSTVLAAALAASAVPALAGGFGCEGECYRQTYVPAQYGVVAQRTLVRAPRPYALMSPGEYRTVHERVAVRPAGRVWTTRRDAWGNKVGCWVDTPAEYAVVSRQVMVRAPGIVPVANLPIWTHRTYPVVTEPAHLAWTPVAHHHR